MPGRISPARGAFFAAALAVCLPALARAQDHPACPPAAPAGKTVALTAITAADGGPIGLGTTIVLHTQGMKDIPGLAFCTPALRLNGRLFQKLGVDISPPTETIRVALHRDTADADAWLPIIGAPPASGKRPVTLDIALSPGIALPPQSFTFQIFSGASLMAGIVLAAAALGATILAARRTALLRDRAIDAPADAATRPYSLAMTQMAFWFGITLGAFLFVTALTGDFNGIMTSQALTLIGISATTAVASVSVGMQKPMGTARHFWHDLLTDDSGLALHRVQIFAWTLVLGAVSLRSIYCNLSLPAFDDNLLTLMGISGATYVGFKFPEQQK